MTEAVGVALITTVGTIAGLALKRQWDISDRRHASNEDERDECERYKVGFRALLHGARQQKQSIIAINTLMESNPDYALARLSELAHEGDGPFERVCDYVTGKISEL